MGEIRFQKDNRLLCHSSCEGFWFKNVGGDCFAVLCGFFENKHLGWNPSCAERCDECLELSNEQHLRPKKEDKNVKRRKANKVKP